MLNEQQVREIRASLECELASDVGSDEHHRLLEQIELLDTVLDEPSVDDEDEIRRFWYEEQPPEVWRE